MGKNPDRLLKQGEVAELIAMSPAWLEQQRFKKTGLPVVRIGRACRYRLSDVLEFIETRRQ
jgi:predicted DNA-binding transcriptional regulator AlpA